jgi:hypothetical protein
LNSKRNGIRVADKNTDNYQANVILVLGENIYITQDYEAFSSNFYPHEVLYPVEV